MRFTVSFPDDLFARLDEARGDVPRSTWLQRAAEVTLAAADGAVSIAEAEPRLRAALGLPPEAEGSAREIPVGEGVRRARPIEEPAARPRSGATGGVW